MNKDLSKCLSELVSAHQAELIEFRFTDLLGRWSHVSYWADTVIRSGIGRGIPVASSNVPGWRVMNDSELLLQPDLSSAFLDPFADRKTLILICDLIDPTTNLQSPVDPRGTLQRAVAWLSSTGVADEVQVGPEFEFYLFDDVRFHVSTNESFFCIREPDGIHNSRAEIDSGNSGHRISFPIFHLASPPSDLYAAIRTEILSTLEKVGLTPLHHQHEAGPSQQEIAVHHMPLSRAADATQVVKYVVQNVARKAGKTATFMPKPLNYVSGSAFHLNLSLSLAGSPIFGGDKHGGLSDTCLYFIGGIIKHAQALNAILNTSINSYRRLNMIYNHAVPLSYSARNRTAPIRIPSFVGADTARIEIRFPDPSCNPYLGMSAILMAGMDGVFQRIDPGPPATGNLLIGDEAFDVRRRDVTTFARDLTEAIISLDRDREFLKFGNVFNDPQIEQLISMLNRQIQIDRGLPHPNDYYIGFST